MTAISIAGVPIFGTCVLSCFRQRMLRVMLAEVHVSNAWPQAFGSRLDCMCVAGVYSLIACLVKKAFWAS